MTNVDVAVQEFLKRELAERFPDVRMLAEEQVNTGFVKEGKYWILDPVSYTHLDVYKRQVVTLEEAPRMGCGVMELDHTSFEWTLTYDEYDIVLEGTLEIEIDGRIVSGGPGDIIYIPKGSHIPVSYTHLRQTNTCAAHLQTGSSARFRRSQRRSALRRRLLP